jgi:hypothetical protein
MIYPMMMMVPISQQQQQQQGPQFPDVVEDEFLDAVSDITPSRTGGSPVLCPTVYFADLNVEVTGYFLK